MRTKSVYSLLVISAAAVAFGVTEVKAGLPMPPGLPVPNVNVRIDGYLPAPPGVHVLIENDRPYYIERERRVYIEREGPPRRHKKEKKHHDNRGGNNGHGRGKH